MDSLRFVNDNNPMLEEAEKLWKHLDNLAESNPEKYREFINQQMVEGKKYFKEQQPTPFAVLEVRLSQPSLWQSLEIVLSSWRKLDNEQLPPSGYVTALEMLKARVYVAMTTEKASRFSNTRWRDTAGLNELLDLVESELEQSHKVHKASILRQSGKYRPVRDAEFGAPELLEMENVLQQSLQSTAELQLPSKSPARDRPLITEVSQPQAQSGAHYQVERLDSDGGPALRVTFHLPSVRAASECTCDITERAVHLLVHASKQKLDVQLPCAVLHDDARARFVKSSSTLVVTAPVKQS